MTGQGYTPGYTGAVAARCTFDRCQAGAILPGAPRVHPAYSGPWPNGQPEYHPGCWAAEQRRMGPA